MDLGSLGVWYFTDGMSAEESAKFAQRVEALGYAALWIPETVGRNPLVHASWLLAHTERLIVATGIANIYHREPGVALAAHHTLNEQSNGRFVLGLGVSHKPMVEGVRGLSYGPPVKTMRSYLNKMKQSPYAGPRPKGELTTVIAALGPQMLKLAASDANGAHPYFSSPRHTAMARDIMGPDALLCVEQKVILSDARDKVLAAARGAAQMYQGLPNYRNNWLRMNLTEADFDGEASERFIDETFATGSVEAIQSRVHAHLEAGATHVCVQPIHPDGARAGLHWDVLEVLAPSKFEN